jgi:prepilin-type N-terminal cleavage/methylation domain-containing protein
MNKRQRQAGFSLIEIMIVLALVALLLLGIFLAFGQTQRARRDFQRRADLQLFYGAMESYVSNTGVHPSDQSQLDTFVSQYFPGHVDPLTGQPYVITYWEFTHNRYPVQGEVIFGREHYCSQNPPDNYINDVGTDFYHDHFMAVWQETSRYSCLDNHGK